MEESKENIISYTSSDKQKSSAYKFLIIEVVVISIIILGALLVLNYFNVVLLSRINPTLFGWLPVSEKTVEEIPYFGCPVASCANALPVYNLEGKIYVGVGFKDIIPNSSLFAIVSGTYSSNAERDETTITLTNEDGLEITYRFKGSAKGSGDVNVGEKIGIYDGGIINATDSPESFFLFVSVKDSRTGELIPISLKDL